MWPCEIDGCMVTPIFLSILPCLQADLMEKGGCTVLVTYVPPYIS
jgi:hypothetical protein